MVLLGIACRCFVGSSLALSDRLGKHAAQMPYMPPIPPMPPMPTPVSPVVTLLRRIGFAEGLSCVALFGIAMPLKYAADMPLAVRIVGSVHGGLFLAFLVVLGVVVARRRWSLGRGVLATIAAVVPFGTFVLDRRLGAWDADPSGVTAAHRRLGEALAAVPAWIGQADRVAPAVSAWSIGQHLDHLLRAHLGITARLAGSAPAEAAPNITVLGRIRLAVGWIPRGQGRASAFTMPQPVDATALHANLAAAVAGHQALVAHLPAIATAPERSAHPAFGGLKRSQWLRFATIQVDHHLRIVRDIARRG